MGATASSTPPTLSATPSSILDAPLLLGCYKLNSKTTDADKNAQHYSNDLWTSFLQSSNFGTTTNPDVAPIVGLYNLFKDRVANFWSVKGFRFMQMPTERCGGDACMGASTADGLHLFIGNAEGITGSSRGVFGQQNCVALYDRTLRNGDAKHVYMGCRLPPPEVAPDLLASEFQTNTASTGLVHLGMVDSFEKCANLTDGVFPFFGILEGYEASTTNFMIDFFRLMYVGKAIAGYRCYGNTKDPSSLRPAVGCWISDGVHAIGGWVSRNVARNFSMRATNNVTNTSLENWYNDKGDTFKYDWYKTVDYRFLDNFPNTYVANVDSFTENTKCPGCPGDQISKAYIPIAWYAHNATGTRLVSELLK